MKNRLLPILGAILWLTVAGYCADETESNSKLAASITELSLLDLPYSGEVARVRWEVENAKEAVIYLKRGKKREAIAKTNTQKGTTLFTATPDIDSLEIIAIGKTGKKSASTIPFNYLPILIGVRDESVHHDGALKNKTREKNSNPNPPWTWGDVLVLEFAKHATVKSVTWRLTNSKDTGHRPAKTNPPLVARHSQKSPSEADEFTIAGERFNTNQEQYENLMDNYNHFHVEMTQMIDGKPYKETTRIIVKREKYKTLDRRREWKKLFFYHNKSAWAQ